MKIEIDKASNLQVGDVVIYGGVRFRVAVTFRWSRENRWVAGLLLTSDGVSSFTVTKELDDNFRKLVA